MWGRLSLVAVFVAAGSAAAGPLRFEAGPGCASPDAFKTLVAGDGEWNVALVPEGTGWSLELSRGEARALVRKLPPAASCEALAEAASLIIERYFREVAAGRAVAPPPKAQTAVAHETRQGRDAGTVTPTPAAKVATPPPFTLSGGEAGVEGRAATVPTAAAPTPEIPTTATPTAATPTAATPTAATPTAATPTAATPTAATSTAATPTAATPTAATPTAATPTAATPTAATPTAATPTAATPTAATPTAATPTAVTPTAATPTAATPTAATPTAATSAAPFDSGSASAQSERVRLDLELSAGGGFLTQAFVDTGAFATADLTLRLNHRWRVGLLGGFASAATRDVTVNTLGPGTAYAVPFVVDAQGGICGTLGIELCGAAVAGIRGIHGGGSGALFHEQPDVWTVSPNLGALVRAQWRPWRGFFIALEAWAAFPLFRQPLIVEGPASSSSGFGYQVFGVQVIDITASLQLGWSWSLTPSKI